MTECNLFCYSKQYNDKNSFQQGRWRAFNKYVGETRYREILKEVKEILGKPKMKLSAFWKQVTAEQWQRLLAIPEASDFRDGFEYISGVKIVDVNSKKTELLKKAEELIAKANELKDEAEKI